MGTVDPEIKITHYKYVKCCEEEREQGARREKAGSNSHFWGSRGSCKDLVLLSLMDK